jgi:uncharacterized membrane protein
MEKDRLIAFSDGVIAVIITIMVLELKAPHDDSLIALAQNIPAFLGYVLSFTYVAIYWNNHHHFFHLVHRVNASILWSNLHLLFWLSLVPFTTSWVGAHFESAVPTAVYGASLLMAALAWYIMQMVIVRSQGDDSALASAIGGDFKGKVSLLVYIAGTTLSFVDTLVAQALYVLVALMWLIPDRRVERAVRQASRGNVTN